MSDGGKPNVLMGDSVEMSCSVRPPKDIELVDYLLQEGLDTFCIVADSVFSTVDQYLSDLHEQGMLNRWVVPSERSIPAIAAGRWLATGKFTVMLMQNSGFSNAMDYRGQSERHCGFVIPWWFAVPLFPEAWCKSRGGEMVKSGLNRISLLLAKE